MQVSVEDVSSVKKVLHVEIPQEDVAREMDEAYGEIGKTAKIKGFRKGKIPRAILERHYQKSVNADVIQKLIQESLVKALEETGLKVVGSPQVDVSELIKNTPYKYNATVEIRPEISELEFKGMELTKTIYTVNDDEVEKQLKLLQETMTQKITIDEDRPAKEEDFVLVSYEAFEKGSPSHDIPRSENYTMKIGAGTIHKDFDEQLIDMKPGDKKEIRVSFPEGYQNKALANKNIDFHVELKEIRKEVPYELDDHFAQNMGNYETLEQLRNAIAENFKEGYEKRTEQELNEQIFQKLLKETDFEVPEVLVKQELDQIINDIEKRVEAHDKSMEELGFTREKLAETHQETAKKQVKRHLILNKIIEQENLSLTDDEIDQGYEDVAKSIDQPVKMVKEFYEMHKENFEFFKYTLLEKKVLKLILENSTITEKEPESKSVESEVENPEVENPSAS